MPPSNERLIQHVIPNSVSSHSLSLYTIPAPSFSQISVIQFVSAPRASGFH